MPTADEHQRQADHNFEFLQTIDPDEFCDWLGTTAFYVAVHLVEKLRALTGQHSREHADRNEFVRDSHPAIHVFYRDLYNISLLTRYGIAPHPWLLPERVLDSLGEIRTYVQNYTPPPGP